MGIPVCLRMQRDPLLCEKPLLCMQEGSFDARLLVLRAGSSMQDEER